MSNQVIEEQLLVCEVLEVFFDLQTKEMLSKMLPHAGRFGPLPSIKAILGTGPLSQNLSLLDQALFERLSAPGLPIYDTLFGIIMRANMCLQKTWNQTPARSLILKEMIEISENYLTTAFTMPDMFPDGVLALPSGNFQAMREVLENKRQIRSKQLMFKLRTESYTREAIQVALDFLKILGQINSASIVRNLFDSCCESHRNFAVGRPF